LKDDIDLLSGGFPALILRAQIRDFGKNENDEQMETNMPMPK